MYIFSGEDFLDRVQVNGNTGQITVFALRGGTFTEACDVARNFARRKGFPEERGFFNPARREGLKTAFLEAVESVPRPIDWYVQAVSSAMGVYGGYKGAKELAAMGRITGLPRLLCVQQESNKPMVDAFEAGSPAIRSQDIVAKPAGIATAILRGDPSRVYPSIRRIVLESNGSMVAVSEQQIRDARRMVEDLEGLSPCFTASAALAGLAVMAKRGGISNEETVLVNITGRDREQAPPRKVCWLERTESGWRPDDTNDARSYDLWGENDMAASTLQRVADTILKTTGLNIEIPVTADTELLRAGLSLDSVSVLEILLALEKEFGVELDARDLFEAKALRTVGTLATFIESRIGRAES